MKIKFYNKKGAEGINWFLVMVIVAVLVLLFSGIIYSGWFGKGSAKISEFACKYVSFSKACQEKNAATFGKTPTPAEEKEKRMELFDQLNLALRNTTKYTSTEITIDQMKYIADKNNVKCLQKIPGSSGTNYLFISKVDATKPIYIIIYEPKNPKTSDRELNVLTVGIDETDNNYYTFEDSELYKKSGTLTFVTPPMSPLKIVDLSRGNDNNLAYVVKSTYCVERSWTLTCIKEVTFDTKSAFVGRECPDPSVAKPNQP